MKKGDRVEYIGKVSELQGKQGTIASITDEGYIYVTYDIGVFRPSKEKFLKNVN